MTNFSTLSLSAPLSYATSAPLKLDELQGFDKTDLSFFQTAFHRQHPELVNTTQTITELIKYLTLNYCVRPLKTDQSNQGTLTGYFQPELKASRTHQPDFPIPVYKRPKELIVIENLGPFQETLKGFRIAGTIANKTLKPYFTREQIHTGALEGQGLEIAFVNNLVDLFFMHVQGSGRLMFDDGTFLNLSYDGTNGYAYTSIGQELVKRGLISLSEKTMQGVKKWLFENPRRANEILCLNKSYVFFQILDQSTGPVGAAHKILTPQGSLAVDPDFIPLGSLVWIDTPHPLKPSERLQRLMIAQDVGGAIKGPLRGDFYWGIGEEAGIYAGAMQGEASFYLLEPK